MYQGSPASGQTVKNICKGLTFTPMVDNMKGPFITLVLVTRNISNGAFSVVYDVNPPGRMSSSFCFPADNSVMHTFYDLISGSCFL